ncbi:MAG: M3 family metallopeptidase, partial [Wenzhouxiangella sp.]|nr:M3 family metallopeptidase [Wenzhouxiangella sp.]
MPGLKITLSALLLALVVLLIFQWSARDGEPDHLHRNIGAPSVELGEDNALLDAALDRTRHLPLDRIGHEQVLPAMSAAVSLSRNRIDAVARESDPASWADTARTLEHAGQPVARASALFHALKQLNGDPAWRELEAPVAELLNDYALHVRRHPDLLFRLRSTRTAGPLTPDSEEQRLNELTYLRLSDHGLGLDAAQRERFSRNEQTLSELADLFRLNLRQSTGRYELLLASRRQLDGLPPNAIARARRDASVRGHEQSWALTLGTHSRFDVLRFSPDRELRRTIYTAWERRAAGRSHGSRGNQAELMRRILELRTEQAVLLGHTDHWQRVLAHGSVRSSSRLQSIFDVIIAAARTGAEREIAAITDHLRATGQAGPPQPWDWWYYRERSGVDVEAVSEWFELESVRDSAFALAEVLWGVSFRPAPDLPVWHADAEAFVVDDANGQRLGVVYLDLVNRRGKSGGAWMSILRPASAPGGPVVVAAANFEAPSTNRAVLLTPHQVETVYHELGHALHVLLSEVDRPSLTAPRLADDFVEVPALILERFALHP